jgi:hypothetical protein
VGGADVGANDVCALVGAGSWAFEAVDNITDNVVLPTNGSFQPNDQLGAF